MATRILDFVGPTHNSDGRESVNSLAHRRQLKGLGNEFGEALRMMLTGWEKYAAAHLERYGEPIGNDYVIGDYWGNVGLAIKRLLDGDTGGLDCGSIAHNITQAIEAAGMETNGYELTGGDEVQP